MNVLRKERIREARVNNHRSSNSNREVSVKTEFSPNLTNQGWCLAKAPTVPAFPYLAYHVCSLYIFLIDFKRLKLSMFGNAAAYDVTITSKSLCYAGLCVILDCKANELDFWSNVIKTTLDIGIKI